MPKIKVDNFNRIGDILSFSSEDDFFYVVVIKRGKDNNFSEEIHSEVLPGKPEASLYLKGFVITSYEDVLKKREEIISLCEENNARAYITINARSFERNEKEPDFLAGAVIAREENDENYNWLDLNPRMLIDVDIDDKEGLDKVDKILSSAGFEPIMVTVSPDGGRQYVMPDRNAEFLDFSPIDEYPKVGKFNKDLLFMIPAVHCLRDAMVILYANLK
jgi:hypothetical protein